MKTWRPPICTNGVVRLASSTPPHAIPVCRRWVRPDPLSGFLPFPRCPFRRSRLFQLPVPPAPALPDPPAPASVARSAGPARPIRSRRSCGAPDPPDPRCSRAAMPPDRPSDSHRRRTRTQAIRPRSRGRAEVSSLSSFVVSRLHSRLLGSLRQHTLQSFSRDDFSGHSGCRIRQRIVMRDAMSD